MGASAVLLEPNRVVRGYLAGEVFCLYRPTSYWREILREDGRQGTVSAETRDRLGWGHAPVPVLLECARDSDANVRWPAVHLIGRTRICTEQTLSALIEALGDEAIEVRLQAIVALGSWGPMARPAFTDLAALLKDPQAQVADSADLALWQIDLPAAVETTGWKRFTSPEWQFSAMMPTEPRQSQSKDANGLVVVHTFSALHRVTHHVVAVSQDPPEDVLGLTEDERLNLAREFAIAGMDGKLVSDQPMRLHGSKGREIIIEVQRDGKPYFIRSRLFWTGLRLYQVNVTYTPEFLNARAGAYFLDSFRLEDSPREEIPPPHALPGD